MNRVILLREKIGKLPVILSHTGVTIRQEGSSAFVKSDDMGKPVLVNLPYLADDASDELMDAIEGFLDHEVAHLLFTDFALTNQSRQEGFGALHGMLEDVRIERLMTDKFPGTGLNLSETGRFFLRRGIRPALMQALEEKDPIQAQGALMAPALRAWGGQLVHEHFMRDFWPLMQDVKNALGPLVNEVEQCNTTADTYALAKKMAAALNAYNPEFLQPPPLPAQCDQAGEGDGQSGPEMPGKPSGLAGAPKFDDLMEGQAEAAPAPQDGEPVDGQPGQQQGEKPNAAARRSFLQQLGAAMQEGFDEKVVDLIGEQAIASSSESDYRVFSTNEDKIEPLPVTSRHTEHYINELESQVAHLCGPMQKNLERIIAARSIATWLPAQRSGRMHSASLARLACNDARVFRKKIEGKSRDVAVELVVDCSGSMEGYKILLASQAAYALSTVLGRLSIAHEVIGFTTRGRPGHSFRMKAGTPLAKEREEQGWSYARYQGLYMPILKGYNERMTANVRARFACLPHMDILSNNVDGECVQIAAQRLASRREKGKIMLVLSDGEPAADGNNVMLEQHLKKVVREVEGSGIKVVGLGIDTTAVKYFYTHHVVIDDINDLPTEVLKQLKEMIAPD